MSARPDPEPCRAQDLGLFEVVTCDGAARIGRLHTRHGALNTPTLLPVVNPNLRTIEPREMWEQYGVEALITNSYVIWKHDDLRERALADGIHTLLDFPGVIVTDSGTFQSYVYGDVEVGPEPSSRSIPPVRSFYSMARYKAACMTISGQEGAF